MIRPAAVAGIFYPEDAAELRRTVAAYVDANIPAEVVPKAIVAPHAGYRYSGSVAGTAYAQIVKGRGIIKRVVLIGPSHRVHLSGLGLSSAEGFASPLGVVPLDHDAAKSIRDLPYVSVNDAAHAPEHGLEVHLPFLQILLGEFKLVPLVCGEAQDDETAGALAALWGGTETLIVISSDLSHFLDYESARRMDAKTARSIETLKPEEIESKQACGYIPLRGLLSLARQKKLQPRVLDLRNSGDTAGPRDCVVGYGAFSFDE